MNGPDAVAALAAEPVAELRHQIDYLATTVALLPVSPRRAAARAAVQAIDRDIASCSGTSALTTQPLDHPLARRRRRQASRRCPIRAGCCTSISTSSSPR
jgi:hypothetical protein